MVRAPEGLHKLRLYEWRSTYICGQQYTQSITKHVSGSTNQTSTFCILTQSYCPMKVLEELLLPELCATFPSLRKITFASCDSGWMGSVCHEFTIVRSRAVDYRDAYHNHWRGAPASFRAWEVSTTPYLL